MMLQTSITSAIKAHIRPNNEKHAEMYHDVTSIKIPPKNTINPSLVYIPNATKAMLTAAKSHKRRTWPVSAEHSLKESASWWIAGRDVRFRRRSWYPELLTLHLIELLEVNCFSSKELDPTEEIMESFIVPFMYRDTFMVSFAE